MKTAVQSVAFARFLFVSALVVSCAGCTTVLNNMLGPPDKPGYVHTCDFGSQFSDAACQSAAIASGCDTYAWDPKSLGCQGNECKVFSDIMADYWGAGVPSHPMGTTCRDNAVAARSSLSTEPEMHMAATGSFVAPAVVRLSAANAPSITEFSLPHPCMQPGPIIVAGGQVVFGATATCTDSSCPSGIFAINSAGTTTLLNNPFCSPCSLTGLAPLPDGGYCFAQTKSFFEGVRDPDSINCLSTTAGRDHFLHVLNGLLAGLALCADGKIWYTDAQLNAIGRLDDAAFAIQTSYLEPDTFLGLAAITSGPDGAMWFTAVSGNQIGRITTNSLGLKALPTPAAQPAGIAAGPDGNVWFTEFNASQIGRITPAGVITEFALPTANAQPLGIAGGPDGALWFTEFNANKIGRVSRFGDITEYAIPTAGSQPAGIVAGPDGNMWFTEFQGNQIGQVTLPPLSALPQVIEFYNTLLDNFFITANASEAAAIDNGSAGPGWGRTGSTFAAGGNTSVCRFYGSLSPGPNSHFYTADAAECASLVQLQASTPASQKRWNFESYDFNTTPALNGACPAGLVPVYRAYNNGFTRGIDSNHRITSSQGAIAEVVNRGWSSEGMVMCAPD